MYHPTRGGVRGGRDRKDLFWYTRDKKSQSAEMEAAKEEINRIKEEEEQSMREALGLAPKRANHPQGNRLDKHEFSELVKRGSTAEDLGEGHAEAARVQGVGFARTLIMDNLRQQKIQKYEEFVDKRLKPDLLHATAQRDMVFEQQKIFADLRRNIENLEKNSVTSLRTMVNLGSEVYVQAEVPSTQHIFVDIGMGFHVEFTWSEALNFIEKREETIARQIEEYTKLIASIKAQIKLVCEGIRELLEFPAEKPSPQQIF